MDSVHIKAHGNRPGARRNGQQKDKTFHVLMALCAERGDMPGGAVRRGNMHTAHGAEVFARDTVALHREGGGSTGRDGSGADGGHQVPDIRS